MGTRLLAPGDTWRGTFRTSAADGSALNATGTPAAVLLRNNAVDATPSVTVAAVSGRTGLYSFSVVIPVGYTVGDDVSLDITATVSGITVGSTIEGPRLDAPVTTRLAPATAGRTLAVDASGQTTVGAVAANAINATAIATGAITSGKFAAGAIDAAAIGTNAIDGDAISNDAVTELQTGLATTANLTTVNNNVTAVGSAVAALPVPPTAAAIATAVLTTADGVETSITLQGALRLLLAVMTGQATAASATQIAFKRADGTTTALTVTHDEDGNRTASTVGTI